MLVCPKWLRVSRGAHQSLLELKDMDESFSEVFLAINGKLSDENVAEIPYEAVAWSGWMEKGIGQAPSQGHIHDGINARRLAAGYVSRDDIPYDGSLGVLLSPEDETHYGTTQYHYLHGGGFAGGSPSSAGTATGPGRTYILCGKFGFGVGTGGSGTFDTTYAAASMPYTRRALASIPFDISELSGPLTNPVVVGTLRAEMSADTFPDRGMPNRGSGIIEETYWGMDVVNIQLLPVTRDGVGWGTDTHVRGYMLMFDVILPGPDHPISKGVSKWWVDWMMLARLSPGLAPVIDLEGGGEEG